MGLTLAQQALFSFIQVTEKVSILTKGLANKILLDPKKVGPPKMLIPQSLKFSPDLKYQVVFGGRGGGVAVKNFG